MSNEKKQIDKLLTKDDKGVSEAEDILTRLWRCVMVGYAIGPNVYEKLLAVYARRSEELRFDRGNFNKLILKDRMTWNSFLQALDFANVVSFKITIELKRKRSKEIMVHSIEVEDVASHVVKKKTKVEDHY